MKLVLLTALLAAAWAHDVRADKKTVCTITVNSSDEKEIFRRNLSPDEFQFVELVESGRPDWLESACRKGVYDDDVQIAQIYLHHRPIADAIELRDVAAAIARMKGSDAQVRALDTLAHYRFSDRESLEELTRLFPLAKSVNVQRAIAGILIRSDYQTIAKADLVQTLSEHRLKSPDGEDSIDVLLRRLRAS